jgi:CMP-N,N'-diacetyllegionaminic acid synthase
MIVWALVPARGGSKSIPLKNLLPLGGVPLLDYGVRAVQACGRISRIICSTDHDGIAARAGTLGIDVDHRPAALATDDAPVADVARDLLARRGTPDVLLLVQPTSPFLLPEHVEHIIDTFEEDPATQSAQTITPVPHNHHAWNQRVVENGRVRFQFAAERARAYNKQSKPTLFVFGNLVAARGTTLTSGGGFFAEPSAAVEIRPPYDFDLDGPSDVAIAEAMLSSGLVRLPHMTAALPR